MFKGRSSAFECGLGEDKDDDEEVLADFSEPVFITRDLYRLGMRLWPLGRREVPSVAISCVRVELIQRPLYLAFISKKRI